MSKKKKPSSAQDLINSLLDQGSGDQSISKKAKAPPLPDSLFATTVVESHKNEKRKEMVEENSVISDSIVFELDPKKARNAQSGQTIVVIDDTIPTVKPMITETATSTQMAQMRAAASVPSHVSATDQKSVVSSTAPTIVNTSAHKNTSNPTASVAKASTRSQSKADDEATMPLNALAKEAPAEGTLRLDDSSGNSRNTDRTPPIDRKTSTEIRFGVGHMSSNRKSGGSHSGAVLTSAEAALKQSESLRIAQIRINEIEKELERVRRENETLASAGETLRRRADELMAKSENIETQAKETKKIFDEEKKVLHSQIKSKDREIAESRAKVEEMETRLEANFKKIRVRERELEHRLEIVKVENATLVSTKDEMIMRLKREIDQLKFETDSGKLKSQELFNQYKDKQETIRRVVRALRIALTILEGDEEAPPVKKAE